MSCQCTIKNHLAFCQRSRFCTWVNSSKISLLRDCLHSLLTCLPPTWGNSGPLEALTCRDPFVRKISLVFPYNSVSLQFQPTVFFSPWCLAQAWTHRNLEYPHQLLHAWASSPRARAKPVFPTVRQKGPQIFLLNVICYFFLGGNWHS